MSKQDRQGARTASDLERKYNFGKSFAEIMGVATDARSAAEEAVSAVYNLGTVVVTVEKQSDGIAAEVTRQSQEIENVRTDITAIKEAADGLKIEVQSIVDDGVSKVKTSMGYTFDDEGLNIAKDGDEIENLVNNRGIYVGRGDDTMLKADADGVEATDVTVNNYLRVAHSRFEKYRNGTDTNRTGLFYVE